MYDTHYAKVDLRSWLLFAFSVCLSLIGEFGLWAQSSAADWRAIASHPIEGADVTFTIEGKTLTLNAHPAEILDYYRRKPAEPELRERIIQIGAQPDFILRAQALLNHDFIYTNYPAVSLTDLDASWATSGGHDRSWSWNHQQLVALQYLVVADSASDQPGHSKYIHFADELTRSWARHNFKQPAPSAMSWHDHGTAYRLRNLMLLFEQLRIYGGDPGLMELLLRMIHAHAEVLADEAFYSRLTNHGFDQSMILYWMTVVFPEMQGSARLHALAWNRLDQEIAFMFTPEGIHVENSPGYHLSVLNTLCLLMDICQTHGDAERAQGTAGIIDKAWRFLAYSLTPEGKMPLIGDTIDTLWPITSTIHDGPGFANFMFSSTQGLQGSPPSEADQVYPKGGYAIFRDAWHAHNSFNQTVYIYFKAGFLSQYHRQDDDLGFLLYGYGEAWLVDSGRYNYEEKNSMRLYVRSAAGHNTIRPMGNLKPIRRIGQVPPGTGIIAHELNPERASVTGQTTVYSSLTLQRRLDYEKPNQLTVYDKIRPSKGKAAPGFELLFHIPNDKKVTIEGNLVTAQAASGARMRIKSMKPAQSIRIVSGQREPTIQGWTSRDMNELEPTQCVIFEFPKGQTEAETQITLSVP